MAACIYTESYLSRALPHMTESHLTEGLPVIGAFNTVIIVSAAEPIPHDFHISRDLCCRPIGISMISHNRSKVLEGFILIFDRGLQPVITIQVHDESALIKPVMTFRKIRSHHKRKALLLCFHLKNRAL